MPDVFIATAQQGADSQPTFILKVTNEGHTIYYVTRAVWTYDMAVAQQAQRQDMIDGCANVADKFENDGEPDYEIEGIVWEPPPEDTDPGIQAR